MGDVPASRAAMRSFLELRQPLLIRAASGVDHHAKVFTQSGDGLSRSVDWRIGNNLSAAPSRFVRVNHTIEIETDGPHPWFNALLSKLISGRGARS